MCGGNFKIEYLYKLKYMNKDMKLRKFITTTIKEYLNEQVSGNKEFIVYH